MTKTVDKILGEKRKQIYFFFKTLWTNMFSEES